MKILIIAPHGDDEILGVGGTIAKYAAKGDQVVICNVTQGKPPMYDELTVKVTMDELVTARKILGVSKAIYLGFPAVMLDTLSKFELNNALSQLVSEERPDVVYIPHSGDIHNDHKIIAAACMVALRPRGPHIVKEVYAYETLSSSEWDEPNPSNLFCPNVWVDISEYIDRKIDAMAHVPSQLLEFPNARSLKAIEALATLRGSTVTRRAAEAFMLIRKIVD